MDPIRNTTDKHILDWEEEDVHLWFSTLGFSQYEGQIKEHKIQGDTLCMLDLEALKLFGIATIGQRLSILKSIYFLKVANDIPFSDDDYIPPSEASSSNGISLEQIHTNVKDQGMDSLAQLLISILTSFNSATRLRALEEDNRTLTLAVRSFSEDIVKLRCNTASHSEGPGNQAQTQGISSENGISSSSTKATEESGQATSTLVSTESSTLVNPSAQETSDASSNTKVSLDDPTWKVLPAALKKHRIKPAEWPNYAMFISYGPPDNRTTRRLETEEKPLYLFKKLKEAHKSPTFVLKNVKDPRTPTEFQNNSTKTPFQMSPLPGNVHNRDLTPRSNLGF